MWALPFIAALAPSERYHQERGLWYKRQLEREAKSWAWVVDVMRTALESS